MDAVEEPTTWLGDWYGTVLFWRPQLALLVNERTLFPVLMPLAPAASLLDRVPDALGEMLARAGVEREFITAELAEMGDGPVDEDRQPKCRRGDERVQLPRERVATARRSIRDCIVAGGDAVWSFVPAAWQPESGAHRRSGFVVGPTPTVTTRVAPVDWSRGTPTN